MYVSYIYIYICLFNARGRGPRDVSADLREVQVLVVEDHTLAADERVLLISLLLLSSLLLLLSSLFLLLLSSLFWVWVSRLRTNGVNTSGAAAEVSNVFWRIGEKGTPWHFWEDKCRLTGVPLRQKKKLKMCSDPMSADPVCPSPSAREEDMHIYIYIYMYIEREIDR